MAERISIAQQVLGIDHPEDILGSYGQAATVLTGQETGFDEYITSTAQSDPSEPRWFERVLDLVTIKDLIAGGHLQHTSTLTDWPAYCRLMRDNGNKKADGDATALLIGAHSAISARAFECLARTEYGADKVIVTDLDTGNDKRRHGKFVYGSGTALPFADASMDFVHTNRLLHMLVDPSSPTSPVARTHRLLLEEIARVMAPGGQVIMVESVPGLGMGTEPRAALEQARRLGGRVCDVFVRAGLERVYTGPGSVLAGDDTCDMAAPLLDPQRPLEADPALCEPTSVGIYARMPAARVFQL